MNILRALKTEEKKFVRQTDEARQRLENIRAASAKGALAEIQSGEEKRELVRAT